MTSISYSKLEKAYAPDFRNKINMARNTNEVYDVFCYTVASMFNKIVDANKFRDTDVNFYPEKECHYELGEKLMQEAAVSACMVNSDIGRILNDMAQSASNRHCHLEKHPEKTNSKIMRH